MTLISLAPSLTNLVRTAPAPQRVPTDNDWTDLYPEIEKLYVCERRKLRFIMRYVEAKFGYKATEQMYKKRLAKWGMQKNSKRLRTSTPSTLTTTTPSRSETPGSMPLLPTFTVDHGLMLELLTSVQTWSISFYDSVISNDNSLISAQYPWPEGCEEVNFMFKIVTDLLDRGNGTLAGRVLRKAFLLVENMVTLGGPAFIWNMLEMMHAMLSLRHLQLFQMLLAHLMSLVSSRIPGTHPLPTMLRVLQSLSERYSDSMSAVGDSRPTPFSSPSPSEGTESAIFSEDSLPSINLLSVIKIAWTLNANILFDRFDHRLFQLYVRVHWDNCSIESPPAVISAARRWLSQIESQPGSEVLPNAEPTRNFIQITPLNEDRWLHRQFLTPSDASLPQNHDILIENSMATLRDHATSIINGDTYGTGNTSALLRILAALVTAEVLGAPKKASVLANEAVESPPTMTRAQAGNIAGAMRTLLDLDTQHDEFQTAANTIERIQCIISFLEYGKSRADPRVIREMWMLEDAFVVAGEYEEAMKIRLLAFRRLEYHVQDIPSQAV